MYLGFNPQIHNFIERIQNVTERHNEDLNN